METAMMRTCAKALTVALTSPSGEHYKFREQDSCAGLWLKSVSWLTPGEVRVG